MLFKNTKNTFKDKKIAFSQLDKWYLQRCRINKDTKDKAIEILQLYLNNKYISVEDKKKIEYFIERSNSF